MFRLFVFGVFVLLHATAQAADCPELRSADGYKELAAILKCQEGRLKDLEANPTPSPSALQGMVPAIAKEEY